MRASAAEVIDGIASRHGVSRAQLGLAQLLHRSPIMLLILGTSKVAHLEENVVAAALSLGADDIKRLDKTPRPPEMPAFT